MGKHFIQCLKIYYLKFMQLLHSYKHLFLKKALKNWVNFETGKGKCLHKVYIKSSAFVMFLMFCVEKLPIQ